MVRPSNCETLARLLLAGTSTTSKDGLDAGDELPRAEWLRDVVVGPDREPDERVDLVGACGEHDHVDVGLGAETPEHLDTVDARHHHVEEHEIRMPIACEVEGFDAVGGGVDLEALGLQIAAHEVADPAFVVGDEHARLRRTRHAPRR